jgi:ABC-type tungstate transport system substrate-binding protein
MSSELSALDLVLSADPTLIAIVRLSLIVSLTAVLFAALVGVPFGALIALTQFRGREGVIVVLNALMGLRRSFAACWFFSCSPAPGRLALSGCCSPRKLW